MDRLLDDPAIARAAAGLLSGAGPLPGPPKRKTGGNGAFVNWLDRLLVGRVPPSSRAVVRTRADLQTIEDRVVQNQMTIVSPNKPGVARWLLRATLLAADWYIRLAGSLSLLPTIHFAQWTFIDGGDNLLFESNYDGTWENYIDDFVDYAFFGLDAIWGHSPVFPPGGSRNVEAFKAVIRQHQHATQVFYSAYPDCTVQNIFEDAAIAAAVRRLIGDRAVRRFVSGTHPQRILQ